MEVAEVTKLFAALSVKEGLFEVSQKDMESEQFLLYMGQYFKHSMEKLDVTALATLLAVLAGQRNKMKFDETGKPTNSMQLMLNSEQG